MASAQPYLTTRIIFPTPGGAAGDASVDGALRVQADVTKAALSTSLKTLIAMDSGGDPLFGSNTVGGGRLLIDPNNVFSNGLQVPQLYGTSGANFSFIGNGAASFSINGGGSFGFNGPIITANDIATKGLGFSPIYGLDNRHGLTAADASAITLYTTTAADQAYRVPARIAGTGGTIVSGIYTVKWTEGGTAFSDTVSITAVGTQAHDVIPIQPDNATTITGQLTTLSGTSPVVNVLGEVQEDA